MAKLASEVLDTPQQHGEINTGRFIENIYETLLDETFYFLLHQIVLTPKIFCTPILEQQNGDTSILHLKKENDG